MLVAPHKQFPPPDSAPSRDQGSDPRTSRPAATPPRPWFTRRPTRRPRHGGLPRPQRHRAWLQRREAMARPGHSLRQTRPDLPSRSRPPRDQPVAQPPRFTRFRDIAPRPTHSSVPGSCAQSKSAAVGSCVPSTPSSRRPYSAAARRLRSSSRARRRRPHEVGPSRTRRRCRPARSPTGHPG